ncbi:hypothetical protein ACWGQ5_53545, partial [Streptomyces sp. NPDC055722]
MASAHIKGLSHEGVVMVEELVGALVGAGCAGLVYFAAAARVVKQYERGVVFRFGRLLGTPRLPGFT